MHPHFRHKLTFISDYAAVQFQSKRSKHATAIQKAILGFFMSDVSVFTSLWRTQALALLLAGAISPIRFVLYVIAQFLGAIAASAVLLGILPGPLRVLCERGNGIGIAQALFFGKKPQLPL